MIRIVLCVTAALIASGCTTGKYAVTVTNQTRDSYPWVAVRVDKTTGEAWYCHYYSGPDKRETLPDGKTVYVPYQPRWRPIKEAEEQN